MTYAYTTTVHHFGQCVAKSVHRKWSDTEDAEIHFERWEPGSRRGDEITLHISGVSARKLCRSLLNIIGNDPDFHKQLNAIMRMQRTPE